MMELVIISGKGGTGKTSIAAGLMALADSPVMADADVDAANLHLIMKPENHRTEIFKSGREAGIIQDKCNGCGKCEELCRFDAVSPGGQNESGNKYIISDYLCEGCGVCVEFCPENAISFEEASCGKWYVSDTRFGPMVHSRLAIAAENSGKLVTLVRNEAKKIAVENNSEWIIVDGPPGIGCPVIASITGASMVLVVVEPTLSGEHDMKRVFSLVEHFKVPAAVCVNKWDLNPANTARIEKYAEEKGIPVVGKISYDEDITRAMLELKTISEFGGKPAGELEKLWKNLLFEKLKAEETEKAK